MEYFLMDPPFEVKDFSKMDKKEAAQHFEWYISEIPTRLNLLGDLVEYTSNIKKTDLDYSKESLEIIWNWYLNNVEIVNKSKKELNNEYANANVMTRPNIKAQKIATGWMGVALDISIYFAECLITKNENIKWGFVTKPKSLKHVNQPVIVGFRRGIELDASNLLFVQTRKVLKGVKDRNSLIKLFERWESKI